MILLSSSQYNQHKSLCVRKMQQGNNSTLARVKHLSTKDVCCGSNLYCLSERILCINVFLSRYSKPTMALSCTLYACVYNVDSVITCAEVQEKLR